MGNPGDRRPVTLTMPAGQWRAIGRVGEAMSKNEDAFDEDLRERFNRIALAVEVALTGIKPLGCIGCGEHNYVAHNVALCGACKQTLDRVNMSI